MRYSYLVLALLSILFFSCKKDKVIVVTPPPDQPPAEPAPPGLLKDIVIPNLPSPYYHFEYTVSGRMGLASFASDLNTYDLVYTGVRLTEMKNTIGASRVRLQYDYDNAGNVSLVKYVNRDGVINRRVFLTYNGRQLTQLIRERKSGNFFIVDKVMEFLYYPDGNLMQLTDRRRPLGSSAESVVIDRFENYDDKINVDDFQLIHNEFFDHLVLLPGVVLQKNNARKEIRTGDGANYVLNYIYTYNNRDQPLAKDGIGTYTAGTNEGQLFDSNATYSYYE
jgi:hypothetical protein